MHYLVPFYPLGIGLEVTFSVVSIGIRANLELAQHKEFDLIDFNYYVVSIVIRANNFCADCGFFGVLARIINTIVSTIFFP